jgi:hypothetical protein
VKRIGAAPMRIKDETDKQKKQDKPKKDGRASCCG